MTEYQPSERAIRDSLWEEIRGFVDSSVTKSRFDSILDQRCWWLRRARLDLEEFLSLFAIELLEARDVAISAGHQLDAREIIQAGERARWRIRKEVRRLTARRKPLDAELALTYPPMPTDEVTQAELFSKLLGKIQADLLPFDMAILLMRSEGKKLREIAATFDIPVSTVHAKLAKVCAMLQRQIEPSGYIDSADRASAIRDEFEARVRAGTFHGLVRPKGAITIAVIPRVPMRLEVTALRSEKVPPPARSGWNHRNRGNSVLSVDEFDNPRSVAEMRADGVILAAETAVLDPTTSRFARNDLGLFVPSGAVEAAIIRSTTAYLKALQEINAPLPWTIATSLIEVKGYWLYAYDGQTAFYKLEEIDIRPDPIKVAALPEPLAPQSVAQILRPAIDFFWREFGFERSSNYTDGGIYNVRFL